MKTKLQERDTKRRWWFLRTCAVCEQVTLLTWRTTGRTTTTVSPPNRKEVTTQPRLRWLTAQRSQVKLTQHQAAWQHWFWAKSRTLKFVMLSCSCLCQDMYDADDDVQGKMKKTHRTQVIRAAAHTELHTSYFYSYWCRRLLPVVQQPNFKQKFVSLLKRFKVTDEVCRKHRSSSHHPVYSSLLSVLWTSMLHTL